MTLFIGQVDTLFAEREAFQEVDYPRIFGGMAKWVTQIEDLARIPEVLARAFSVATSGRPGPVVIAIPCLRRAPAWRSGASAPGSCRHLPSASTQVV
jgi:thiamine pyrophosphate-dependent acetolactate synthase large subunit-like protein